MQSESTILYLAVVSVIISAKRRLISPLPLSPQGLSDCGFFNYLPYSWCYGKTTNEWLEMAAKMLSPMGRGNEFARIGVTEDVLIRSYLNECKTLPLFGSSLFSVIRKEDPMDYVCAINNSGCHVLTNDGNPKLIGTIPFPKIVKLGN